MCITPSIINSLFQDVCDMLYIIYQKFYFIWRRFRYFLVLFTEEIFSLSVFYVCDMQICSRIISYCFHPRTLVQNSARRFVV